MKVCAISLAILLLQLMFAPAGVLARDYYVSVEGNDSHAGSKSEPWQSIERVNSVDFEPGDRVLFRGGGTFQGSIELDNSDNGDEQKKVVVSSYGNGSARIQAGDGNGLTADNCSHLVIKNLAIQGSGRTNGSNGSGISLTGGSDISVEDIEASHFRLCGVTVSSVEDTRIAHVHAHDNGHAGIASGRPRSSKLGPSKNLYVAHCVTENNPGNPKNKENHSGNGIVIGFAEDVIVEYCLARNNGWDMPREGNGPVGIWTFNTKNIIIQHCVSHDNRSPGDDGGGFDIDGGTENCIMQYNLSYNNDGPGYFLCQYPTAPPLKNNIIRYNISQNDGRKNNRRAGIYIFAAEPNASGCEIYNNTVYNDNGSAVGFGGYHIPGVVFRNNIFVAAREPIVGDYSAAQFEGNLWWSLGSEGFRVGDFKGFDQWIAATKQEKTDGTQLDRYADPKLVDAGRARCDDPKALNQLTSYRLLPNSPSLEAGIVIPGNGGRDFWGNAVSSNQPPSLGAWEQPIRKVDASQAKVHEPLPR